MRLNIVDDLASLKKLAGVGSDKELVNNCSNISITGTEKAQLMRKHGIKPGTPEWFQLWFSKPYLTGEKPVGK
jgi:hypothetical protein